MQRHDWIVEGRHASQPVYRQCPLLRCRSLKVNVRPTDVRRCLRIQISQPTLLYAQHHLQRLLGGAHAVDNRVNQQRL